jgi:Holliday junction DNA helicase RuvA
MVSLYVSQIIKENAHDLYGFENLRQKKLFELLLTVRGVGPKSAYALMSALPVAQIVEAIQAENKKLLTQAPGVGDKAAAQIILDLAKKIHKIKMYTSQKLIALPQNGVALTSRLEPWIEPVELSSAEASLQTILDEALMACRELGFKEDKIIPVAQKVMSENQITKPEQLVHLVLRQI